MNKDLMEFYISVIKVGVYIYIYIDYVGLINFIDMWV